MTELILLVTNSVYRTRRIIHFWPRTIPGNASPLTLVYFPTLSLFYIWQYFDMREPLWCTLDGNIEFSIKFDMVQALGYGIDTNVSSPKIVDMDEK